MGYSSYRSTLLVLGTRQQTELVGLIGIQVDEAPNTGKISLGLSVVVRVTLKDGTYHEVGSPEAELHEDSR